MSRPRICSCPLSLRRLSTLCERHSLTRSFCLTNPLTPGHGSHATGESEATPGTSAPSDRIETCPAQNGSGFHEVATASCQMSSLVAGRNEDEPTLLAEPCGFHSHRRESSHSPEVCIQAMAEPDKSPGRSITTEVWPTLSSDSAGSSSEHQARAVSVKVDLAGSERVIKTGVAGTHLVEAQPKQPEPGIRRNAASSAFPEQTGGRFALKIPVQVEACAG